VFTTALPRKVMSEAPESGELLVSGTTLGIELTPENYSLMRRLGEGYLWKHYRDVKYYEELKEYLNEAIWVISQKYDPSREVELKTFFYRAFANAVISYIRSNFGTLKDENYKPTMSSNNVEYLSSIVDSEPNAEMKYYRSLQLRWVNRRLREVSEVQRESFMLRYYHDFTLEEIAVRTRVNRSTVLWRCNRAREYLLSCLHRESVLGGCR
jgi:RNA polymerase sigma factor (sigma-70 family)